MAEGDATVYNQAKLAFMDGALDPENDTLKVALLTSSYTPNIDTDQFWSGISANEESGTGYTAGGETVANVATALDTTNDRAEMDGDDVTWTGLDVGTPGYAVLYQDTGNAATSRLICYWELGSTASNGGDYTLSFNAEGILYIA